MPHFISIQNLQDAGLDIYARLSEVQLLRYREPKPGIFIAESPIVVERALAAGYRPISVLMDEAGVPKQQGLLKVCGEIPVYTARFDVLTQITGFKLTRGMLCAMERNELPQADILCRDMYRIAVLEDVMNPTNVGAIFRSAAALGMDASDTWMRRSAIPESNSGQYGYGIPDSVDVSAEVRRRYRAGTSYAGISVCSDGSAG